MLMGRSWILIRSLKVMMVLRKLAQMTALFYLLLIVLIPSHWSVCADYNILQHTDHIA